MAKRFFCSECGTQLQVTRKALKNKAMIVDLVTPHVCDEDNLNNITDADRPTERAVPMSKPDPNPPDVRPINFDIRDRRKKEHVKSTAPSGVLNQLENLGASAPERTPTFNDDGENDD